MERVWNKVDSKNVCYGGGWDDVKSTLRASVFAIMLELAQDRVKHYKSDLYHDAQWIAEEVTGPMSFEWIARESGTFIGDVTSYVNQDDWDQSVRYRFEILMEGNSKWMVNIYEAGPLELIPNVPDTEDYILPDEYTPFFNEDPLPENVVRALVNTDVNPINWTPEKVEEIVNKANEDNQQLDNIVHEALPIGMCVMATTAAGCIYHPAPPINHFHSYTDEEKIAIAEATFPSLISNRVKENETLPTLQGLNSPGRGQLVTKFSIEEANVKFPTLRNESNRAPTKRKVSIRMESILQELREKLDDANSARDEAYDAKSELDDAIGEFDNYIDEVETLIDSLSELPSISVDLDVRVSFESS